jgi:hypothetical protein
MKQSLDRVLGEWERSANNEHMFGYLLGMSAFSLEENLWYANTALVSGIPHARSTA